ncbi:MAG TPA: SDR family oxidoreductase [Gemmataceae bacterium]|nr:SDR family oxidoreductase [Gemmataceae bacterium]
MTVCLVTGGAGFIGSHLVEALVERGHTVRVLDNFSTGALVNLAGVRDRVHVLDGDITDLTSVQTAMEGVEVVFHQAALASVPRSIANPLATHQACATGTLHVLMAARDAGARRVVYAASSSAYGGSRKLPKCEDDPTLPLSPYAVAKLTGEQYCAVFADVYELETVRLRYFNVFGPRQSPDSPYAAVIPKFIEAMTSGRSPLIHGDGTQSRDFTFVADVVQANLLAAEAPGVSGKVYNIACGRRTSLLELVEHLNTLLGADIKPEHTDARPGDVRHSLASIDEARDDLNYEPTTDIVTGLRRCLEWWRQRHPAAAYGFAGSPSR